VREREWKGLIQIDGGVCPENAGILALAGADCLVAGASAFRKRKKGEPGFQGDYADQVKRNIEEIRDACKVAMEQGVDIV
jgi:pentose-5-phosphate-3-epimerase